jgi:hypothetical protein
MLMAILKSFSRRMGLPVASWKLVPSEIRIPAMSRVTVQKTYLPAKYDLGYIHLLQRGD